MKIVADENITFLNRFFDDMGEVLSLPGREIGPEDVVDADVLLVRSVTPVNANLLEGSSVNFVGTCTIGTDHLDIDYLDNNKITWANAPGSNANSVVEYVVSCLSILTETHNFSWEDSRIGIVGFGNVGSLLAQRLTQLGIDYCACDPFIDSEELTSLDEVMSCDLITLHVPLTTDGEHPTFHMIDEQCLNALSERQILINTSRGSVVDNKALNQKLIKQPRFTSILDVWENEPEIDPELCSRVFLGTPHIAGYSFDGKVSGTEMVYQKLCNTLGLPVRHKAAQFLEEPPLSKMVFTSMADHDWCLHTAIRACFDVRHDNSVLKASLELAPNERRQTFDALRKNYRCRREFSGVKIQLKQGDSALSRKFKALEFNLRS